MEHHSHVIRSHVIKLSFSLSFSFYFTHLSVQIIIFLSDHLGPCRASKCIQKGDLQARCGQIDVNGIQVSQCICSDNFILSGGVCIPVFEPECCYSFKEICDENIILFAWCTPATSAIASYRIYKDNEMFLTVANTVTETRITA